MFDFYRQKDGGNSGKPLFLFCQEEYQGCVFICYFIFIFFRVDHIEQLLLENQDKAYSNGY